MASIRGRCGEAERHAQRGRLLDTAREAAVAEKREAAIVSDRGGAREVGQGELKVDLVGTWICRGYEAGDVTESRRGRVGWDMVCTGNRGSGGRDLLQGALSARKRGRRGGRRDSQHGEHERQAISPALDAIHVVPEKVGCGRPFINLSPLPPDASALRSVLVACDCC